MEIAIRWVGRPLSKSNRYEIVRRGRASWQLKKSSEVDSFEAQLIALWNQALAKLGHTVEWYVPPGRKLARPRNPLFAKRDWTAISIVHHRPGLQGPDIDGVKKSILDSATRAGVWLDDRYCRRDLAGWDFGPFDYTEIAIRSYREGERLEFPFVVQQPSPLSRREWHKQQQAEEAMEHREEPVIVVFCHQCGAGIGPGCVQDEAWLLPVKKRNEWEVLPICRSCADWWDLDRKYRVMPSQELARLGRFEAANTIHKRGEKILAAIRQATATRHPR